MRWAALSFAVLILLGLSLPAGAQEISGNFEQGAVKVGPYGGVCDSSLEGAIRYDNCLIVGGGVCPDGTYYLGLSPDGNVPLFMTDVTYEGGGLWAQGYTNTGFTSTTDGDGNTAGLAALGDAGAPYDAAVYCDDLDAHNHQDWYLPAEDELDLIWNNGAPIGDIDTGGTFYWTSTEYFGSWLQARRQRFSDGVQAQMNKPTGNLIRCVRKDAAPGFTPDLQYCDGACWQSWGGGLDTTCTYPGYCWGRDVGSGKLGNGPGTDTSTPGEIVDVSGWTQISAGYDHTCGITNTGDAYCWGHDGYEQLGNGAGGSSETPALVDGGYGWTDISVSYYHSCGIRDTGDAYCWGTEGTYGNLGNGETGGSEPSPVLVSGGYTWTDISASISHSCGITDTGDAYCWGYGANGRLGNGGTGSSSTPQLVSGGHTWETIGAGYQHTCGLTTAGDAYCWGDNTYYQFGDGTQTGSNVPTIVSGGHTWTQLSVHAGYHACAIKDNSDAYCWGHGQWEQQGDGVSAHNTTPGIVSGGHSWTDIAVGYKTSCGVTNAGDAYCWGQHYGSLGDGSTTISNTPILVSGGHTWIKAVPGISVTSNHSCGIVEHCCGGG